MRLWNSISSTVTSAVSSAAKSVTQPTPPSIDTPHSAITDHGDLENGIGPTYRSKEFANGLVEHFSSDISTLGDVFERSVRQFPVNL
jgi:hypothetical protein